MIAGLWARTVKSPNPAFAAVDVPLASTFMLSTKKGKEAYVEPVIEGRGYRFAVKVGTPEDVDAAKRGTKAGGSGSPFLCLMSGTPMPFDYLRSEAKSGRMGARLMAVVAEGDRGRVYLTPTLEHEAVAEEAEPKWTPDTNLPERALGFRVQEYGMNKWRDLFTPRQLVALTTFSDLVVEAMERVKNDLPGSRASRPRQSDESISDESETPSSLPTATTADHDRPLRDGGAGATAYAEAVGLYLAMALNRMANTICTIARWTPDRGQTVTAFARQAIPMTWDFPDVNPFAGAAGDYGVSVDGVIKGMMGATELNGFATQQDAALQSISVKKIVSTDPPYYDNIGYADLSDFFYVWLRRTVRSVYPDLFSTLAVPKAEELVATPHRHGNKEKAETFFLAGMTDAMRRLAEQTHPGFPVSIYCAFKQPEKKGATETTNTGWETFLAAVIHAGFSVTGTWPMRTEQEYRTVWLGTNALASSHKR